MTGHELLRKLRRVARRRGVALHYEPRRGKGSHGTLLLGGRRTVLKDPRKEIGRGLLRSMLADLGIDPDELDQDEGGERCATPTR